MQSNQYQLEFSRTAADVFYPENVHPYFVGQCLKNRAQSAGVLDAVKRALYYNNNERLDQMQQGAIKNPVTVDFNVDADTLHAILGMEGEVSEITEAALKQDRAKIVDESGDFLWYLCLLLRRHNISLDEVMDRNIAKLKARFPEKFTLDLAVNRDLAAEEKVFQ